MKRLNYLFIILSAFIGFIAFASMVYGFISILDSFGVSLYMALFITAILIISLSLIKNTITIGIHEDVKVCDELNKEMYQIKDCVFKWHLGEVNTYDCMFAVLKVLQEDNCDQSPITSKYGLRYSLSKKYLSSGERLVSLHSKKKLTFVSIQEAKDYALYRFGEYECLYYDVVEVQS